MPELLLNVTNMLIDHQVFEKARRSRDPRFDGRFFVAVRTTGIYCRPICRVKLLKSENVTFFQTAAAATEAPDTDRIYVVVLRLLLVRLPGVVPQRQCRGH